MGGIGPVGIVGGGPAGAELARRLAEARIACVLYEAAPYRAKPCGGGLTPRAMERTPPSVREATPSRPVFQITSRSPSDRTFDLRLSEPVTIVSRKAFDQQLRRAAEEAGAKVVYRRVRTVEQRDGFFIVDGRDAFSLLAGAGGFNCPVARALAGPLPAEDLAASVGYYLEGEHPSRIVIRFVSGLAGYLWFFPGPSAASVGIAGPARGFSVRRAETMLKNFLESLVPGQAPNGRYVWAAPCLRTGAFDARPVAGENWLLLGDAAGLCDPITGEGIAHALESAALAARAIQTGDLESYRTELEKGIVRELRRAAVMKEEFFKPGFLRMGHLVMSGSAAANDLCRRFAEGKISYHDLKPESYRLLPKALFQVLGSRIGRRG